MPEVLSNDEIDQLLAAISSGKVAAEEVEAPTASRKIKIYDFKRPDKFSKDQIGTVSMMHEGFARLVTTNLSAQLQLLANVHVASVDQLTYEEFIRSIPNPTTLAVIHMDPLQGSAILEIDPAVSFCILDRLFGGTRKPAIFPRELTEIERSVMEGICVRFLGNLRESWTQVIDLRPRLKQIETNPQFAQVVPPSEMVVLVTMETRIGDLEGMMNLCIPYLTIEPLLKKLSARYWYSSIRRGTDAKGVAATLGLDLPAEVLYEGERISLRDLGRLRKGSLVKIPGYGQGRAFLRMGGRTLFGLEAREGGLRKPPRYAVVGRSQEEKLPSLEPVEETSRPSEIQRLEAGLRETLQSMESGIGASLEGMKNAIGTLQKKQGEMADQLAFTAPEPEAREAKGSEVRARPFDFLRHADPAHLLGFLQQEHPQLIALVLSYLEPQRASGILETLPPDLQPDVAGRIACMGRTQPGVLREVERVLERKLTVRASDEYSEAGGVEGLAEILNMADRSTEKLVVESLEKDDPELAEEIKRRMFVFEDIVVLDGKAVEAVLGRTEADTLLRALKAAPENVRKFLWENMSREDAKKLRQGLEEMGPVRLHEVEQAQRKIVATIRSMDENGEILVARAGEEAKIVK